MLLNWLAFFGLGVVSYTFISLYGQLTGGNNTTIAQTAFSAIKPLQLIILIVGNIFFAIGLFYGFKNTQFAIPAFIATGIITSYVYSLGILSGTFSLYNLFGVALVLCGIFFLR